MDIDKALNLCRYKDHRSSNLTTMEKIPYFRMWSTPSSSPRTGETTKCMFPTRPWMLKSGACAAAGSGNKGLKGIIAG